MENIPIGRIIARAYAREDLVKLSFQKLMGASSFRLRSAISAANLPMNLKGDVIATDSSLNPKKFRLPKILVDACKIFSCSGTGDVSIISINCGCVICRRPNADTCSCSCLTTTKLACTSAVNHRSHQ